jgi:hypothetical protein
MYCIIRIVYRDLLLPYDVNLLSGPLMFAICVDGGELKAAVRVELILFLLKTCLGLRSTIWVSVRSRSTERI